MRLSFIKELPFFMAIPAFIWQFLFFCIPLFLIVAMSVISISEQTDFSQVTLHHYATFFGLHYFTVIARSLFLALSTAITCAFFAYPVAYHLVFHVKKWRNFLFFFLMIPFWTNLLVQVYAWFFVLERHGLVNSALLGLKIIEQPLQLLNTPFAIYIVMISCYMPFMVIPIYASLEKFDMRFLEASADLGAQPWQTFLRITLPLSALGIRTGFFLVFIPSFGEFVIPALMGGGKHLYVGSLISHYFLVAGNPYLGSAFTCFTGLILLGCVGIIYILFNYLFSLNRSSR